MLKAFLLHQYPSTAELRIPQILSSRSAIDKDIFKRLVWGLSPIHIAQNLNTEESLCAEIEDLLAAHSPRVWSRILANRRSRTPHIRPDAWDTVAHPGLDPASTFEAQAWQELLAEAFTTIYEILPPLEIRILILLYNRDLKASEIVARATSDPSLSEITDINRVYYLKDRALDSIVAKILDLVQERTGHVLSAETKRRELYKYLEELLRQQGISPQRK